MGSEEGVAQFSDPGPLASQPAYAADGNSQARGPQLRFSQSNGHQTANERLAAAFASWSFDSVHTPWYRSLPGWFVRDDRNLPPLEVTSRPVPVADIWGTYDYRRRSLLSSSAAHAALLLLAFAPLTQPVLQGVSRGSIHLVIPIDVVPFAPASPPPAATEGGREEGQALMPRFELDQPRAPGPQFLMPPVAIEPGLMTTNLVLPMQGDPLAQIARPKGRSTGRRSDGGPGGGTVESAEDPTPVFKPGGEVSPPTLEFQVDPQYSEPARRQRLQGTVLLAIEVWPDGRAHRIRIQRGLGLGLDEKAVEAVRKWRFLPGTKSGTPVRVSAIVEVIFQLF